MDLPGDIRPAGDPTQCLKAEDVEGENLPRDEAERRVYQRMWRYIRMQTHRVADNLAGVDLPGEGEARLFLTQKGMNAFTVLLWIIDNAGSADHVMISTYSMNQRIIASFEQLLDEDKIKGLDVIILDSMTKHQPDRISELRGVFDRNPGRVRVALCRNHSKITLARCGEQYFTVTGSGNYSFDTKIEQYEMFASRDLHEWVRGVLETSCFEERHDDRHTVWEG